MTEATTAASGLPDAGRRAPLPFSVLGKPTGAACNLDCTYCFFLSKDALTGTARMSREAVHAHLTNLFASSPDGEVVVAWQGGEPTLRGLAFYREAVDLAQTLRRPGQQVTHTMQTNGTLLDDEWGAFFAEHDVLVGLSLDGPADVHDAYRVNRAGRGTYAQAVRGWQVLRRHAVRANVLCTVHAANESHGARVYRHFVDDLGARHLQFIPVVERVTADLLPVAERGWKDEDGRRVFYRQEGEQVTGRSVTPRGWGRFLTEVFDEWFPRHVGEVSVQQFEAMVGNRLGSYTLCYHSPVCGTALAAEPDGGVYSCDHFVEPEHRLGDFTRSGYADLLASDQQQRFGRAKRDELPEECRSCAVRWACHGGCPKDRFALSRDGSRRLNHLCGGYYDFFTHATPAIERIASTVVRRG